MKCFCISLVGVRYSFKDLNILDMNLKEKASNPQSNPQFLEDLPNDYESWQASQKQAFLWEEKILRSKYDRLPSLRKIDVAGLFLTVLKAKMDLKTDQALRDWKKAIHAHGSVAKIKFVSAPNTPFTGLFKGANYGLLRCSVTGNPADRGFAPGLAIKFLVDGQPSENFSALVSLTGQGNNYNFFANEFSNIVPVVNQIGPKLINSIFRRVSKYPTKLFLQDLSKIDQDGQPQPEPRYPAQIFLVPNPAVQFPDSPPHDFRDDLATIAPGTQLFSVYAIGNAEGETMTDELDQSGMRQNAQWIGSIETTSEFVCSAYGDSQLFFRHQRFRNR
jgi:hypothetical protein